MTAALEGGEWSASRPGRTLPPGKTQVPILQEAGWTPGLVWTTSKIKMYVKHNRTYSKENVCSASEYKFRRCCNEFHAKAMTDVICKKLSTGALRPSVQELKIKYQFGPQHIVFITVNDYQLGPLRPALRRCN